MEHVINHSENFLCCIYFTIWCSFSSFVIIMVDFRHLRWFGFSCHIKKYHKGMSPFVCMKLKIHPLTCTVWHRLLHGPIKINVFGPIKINVCCCIRVCADGIVHYFIATYQIFFDFFLLYRYLYLYEWNYHLIGKNSRQETFIKYKSESVTEGVHFCPSCFFH